MTVDPSITKSRLGKGIPYVHFWQYCGFLLPGLPFYLPSLFLSYPPSAPLVLVFGMYYSSLCAEYPSSTSRIAEYYMPNTGVLHVRVLQYLVQIPICIGSFWSSGRFFVQIRLIGF